MNQVLENTRKAGSEKLSAIRNFDFLGAVGLQKKSKFGTGAKVAAAVGALAVVGVLTARHMKMTAAPVPKSKK